MTTLPFAASLSRMAAVGGLLATVACAPAAPPQSSAHAGNSVAQALPTSTPVLLSCPAGQQPLMRQVLVNAVAVPQVECVDTRAVAPPTHAAPMAALAPAASAVAFAPPYGAAAAIPVQPTVAPQPVVYDQPASVARPARTTTRPVARRAVYDGDIVEYERPARRTWQKSAVIIGSAAGAGAGVGALTGGKKGALIGAAVGGGAATVWDQVTRRQPR